LTRERKMNQISAWLDSVKEALIADGFVDTILQIQKPNQVFGLVKKLVYPWEMHARGFSTDQVEAEIEISREYLEHLDDQYRRSALEELLVILERYGISYQVEGEFPQQYVTLRPPPHLTPWAPFVIIGIAAFLLIILSKEK